MEYQALEACWTCKVIELEKGLMLRFCSEETGAFMLVELMYAVLTHEHAQLLKDLAKEKHTYQELCELVGMIAGDCELSSDGYIRQQQAVEAARSHARQLSSGTEITIQSGGGFFSAQYFPRAGKRKSFRRFRDRSQAECYRLLLVAELMKRAGQVAKARDCLVAAKAFYEPDREWIDEIAVMELDYITANKPRLLDLSSDAARRERARIRAKREADQRAIADAKQAENEAEKQRRKAERDQRAAEREAEKQRREDEREAQRIEREAERKARKRHVYIYADKPKWCVRWRDDNNKMVTRKFQDEEEARKLARAKYEAMQGCGATVASKKAEYGSGVFFHRSEPRWRVQWKSPAGRRLTQSFPEEESAIRFAETKEEELKAAA